MIEDIVSQEHYEDTVDEVRGEKIMVVMFYANWWDCVSLVTEFTVVIVVTVVIVFTVVAVFIFVSVVIVFVA
jgi:hypothetical protein